MDDILERCIYSKKLLNDLLPYHRFNLKNHVLIDKHIDDSQFFKEHLI